MNPEAEAVREEYEQVLMGVRIELQDSEAERKRLLRKTKALQAEIDKQRGVDASENADKEFFDLWVTECGRDPVRTIFGPKRQAIVRHARKVFEPHPDGDDVIRNAIRGVGRYRYVVERRRSMTGTEKQRYDDLELILRDEVNVAKFAKLLVEPPDAPKPAPKPTERQVHPRGRQFDPIHELSNALQRAGCKMRGNPYHHDKWAAQCPAHDDRDPSLSIELRNGKVLLYCFAGCSTKSVLEALDLEWCDLFAPDFRGAEIVANFPPPPEGRKAFDQLGIDWS